MRDAVLAFKGRSSLDLPSHLSAEASCFITTVSLNSVVFSTFIHMSEMISAL